jgi:hypothetical protein
MSEAIVYEKTLEAMWEGGAGALSGTVKAVGVDTAIYTRSAAHDFYNDLTGVVSAAVTISSKAFTDGIFTTPNVVTLTGVNIAEHLGAIVTFVDTGTPSTSRLLTYCDLKTDSTPVDVDGTGENITVEWPDYVGRI